MDITSFFRRTHKKDEPVLVIDIGSGSAAMAVAITKPSGDIFVTHGKRIEIPFEKRTEEQTIAGVKQALAEVGDRILPLYSHSSTGQKLGAPTRCIAVIRAPWSKSATVSREMAFPEPRRVTPATVAEIARAALANDTIINRKNGIETGVIRVTVNGYPARGPREAIGSEIGVTVLESDCDPRVRAMVAEVLAAIAPGRSVIFVSGVRAVGSVLHNMAENIDEAVVVDVGSEASNVIRIREGIVASVISVPVGSRTIVHRIAGDNGFAEDTLSRIRMVARDACGDQACTTLATALSGAEPEFVQSFGEAFTAIAGEGRLPSTLLLFAHPDLAPWLAHFFARLDFSQFTAAAQPFVVRIIGPEHVGRRVQSSGDAAADIGILADVTLVNTSHQS